MKTRSLTLFLHLLILCTSAFSQDVMKMSLNDFYYIQRAPIRDQFFAHAAKIVEETKDHEAKSVLEFLKKHHVLGMLHGSGTASLEPVTTNTLLAFIPIPPQDITNFFAIKPGTDMRKTMGVSLLMSNKLAIVVRFDYRLSWFAEGIVTLHEGLHTKKSIEREKRVHTQDEYVAEEVVVREFELRLCQLIGKNHYETVIKQEMDSIEKGLKKYNSKIGEIFADPSPYNPLLELAFGKSGSDLDRNYRRTIVTIDATFRLLEKEYRGKELEKHKKIFLRQTQDKSDYLPE